MEVERDGALIMLKRINQGIEMEVNPAPDGIRNEVGRQGEAHQTSEQHGMDCEYHFE
jgi:hypothetical protein